MTKEELIKLGVKKDVVDKIISSFNKDKCEISQKYREKIKKMQLEYIIQNELKSAGAKNLKAVMALLNVENLNNDEKSINNLKEQIKKLASNNDTSFLFSKSSRFTGVKPIENKRKNNHDTKNLNYSQLCDYLKQNEN